MAQESFSTPFGTPSTGSTQQYSGRVNITVSGIGASNSTALNDAFYNVPSGSVEPSGYYQLGFGTSPLSPYDAANAIVNLLGARPAYNAAHIYSFALNLGATPTNLYFGVTDGQFQDNSGAFQISISPVPEPAAWALMMAGFCIVGVAMRRRKVAVTYA